MDLHAAFGPVILGHGDKRVAEAAFEAVGEADLVAVGDRRHAIALAERIVGHVPSAEQVLLCNSCSEATFHAIRLARVATSRRLVVKFHGGYHGWHDYLAFGAKAGDADLREPTSSGMPESAAAEVEVLEHNVDGVRKLFDHQGDQIAAVLVEPILHTVGCILPAPGFLEALRDATERVGSVLIFDEIVTGFRHHLGGTNSCAA